MSTAVIIALAAVAIALITTFYALSVARRSGPRVTTIETRSVTNKDESQGE